MSSFDEQWEREAERWTPRRVKTWLWILVIIALFGGVAVWGLKTLTSDAKGRGDVIQQKNSADNRIAAESRFNDLYNGIKAQDRKVQAAQEALATFQKTTRPSADVVAAQQWDQRLDALNADLQGLKSACADAQAAYDSEAQNPLSRDFRPAGLPESIAGATDPAVDCK